MDQKQTMRGIPNAAHASCVPFDNTPATRLLTALLATGILTAGQLRATLTAKLPDALVVGQSISFTPPIPPETGTPPGNHRVTGLHSQTAEMRLLPGTSPPTVLATPLKAGILRGTGTLRIEHDPRHKLPGNLPEQAPLPFSHTFVRQFFGMASNPHTEIPFELPAVPVKPLPPLNETTDGFLGLVGPWIITVDPLPDHVTIAEPFELTVRLQATGPASLATLVPPTLTRRGFDIGKPTIRRQQTFPPEARITWTWVPRTVPTSPLRLLMHTFDQGAYRRHTIPLPLQVLPRYPVSGSTSIPRVLLQFPDKSFGMTLLRPAPNWHAWTRGAAIATLGIAVFLATAGLARRKERRDTDAFRKRALRDHAVNLLQTWERAPTTDHPAILLRLRHDLQALLDAPPGATLTELARLARERSTDLEAALQHLEESRHARNAPATLDTKTIREAIRNITFTTVAITGILAAPLAQATSNKTPQSPWEHARLAFEKHDFVELESHLEQLQSTSRNDPAVAVAMGNAAYWAGHHPTALAYYRRAQKLSPRNTEIRNAIVFLENALGLPSREPGLMHGLREIRDRCRPGEWIAGAGIIWLAWGIAAAIQRLRSASKTALTVMAAALTALCIACWATQRTTTYRRDAHAVALAEQSPKIIPNRQAEANGTRIKPGESVICTETQGAWIRVQAHNAEGWMETEGLTKVW